MLKDALLTWYMVWQSLLKVIFLYLFRIAVIIDKLLIRSWGILKPLFIRELHYWGVGTIDSMKEMIFRVEIGETCLIFLPQPDLSSRLYSWGEEVWFLASLIWGTLSLSEVDLFSFFFSWAATLGRRLTID